MGTSSSKFKKYLQHGDEYAAMQVYQNSSELRKNLHPNFGYGDHHQHNTPIHYASRHGMKHLIRAFLSDLDGNPNKRNGLRQTSLHSVCQVIGQQKSPTALERRSYSVMLLLSWRGPLLPNGQRERVDINAQDAAGFTALHYAAQSGLKRCVEYLIAHGANVFLETLHERLTACDLAMRENHLEIALFLESKMAFNSTPESLSVDSSAGKRTRNSSLDAAAPDCSNEGYSGLRAQDLQEAKDQLLVETADLLRVPLFTAEALLRHSEWSREIMLEKWVEDPIGSCKLAGVDPPSSLRRRPLPIENYQEIPVGPQVPQPQQHRRQRHIISTSSHRFSIGKQPMVLHYAEQSSIQQLTKTLPSIKEKLPALPSIGLTKSSHLSSTPLSSNLSPVPKNAQNSNSSTMQVLPKPLMHFSKPKMIHSANSFVVDETLAEDELLCELCCDLIESDFINDTSLIEGSNSRNEVAIEQLVCGHNFCPGCWKKYLEAKIITEAKSGQIVCPGIDCYNIVPIQIMERYISPTLARRYLDSCDIEDDTLEEQCNMIKWCPYPGCQSSLQLPSELGSSSIGDLAGLPISEDYTPQNENVVMRALSLRSHPDVSTHSKIIWGVMNNLVPSYSYSLDCGAGHFFCLECGGVAHAPLGCMLWRKWLEKCSMINLENFEENVGDDMMDMSSIRWLITNNKQCPNCTSFLEKIDGCNRVQCVQCRHEFCWICLEGWKKHDNSAAVGYIRCNQFPLHNNGNISKSNDDYTYSSSMDEKDITSREDARFIHYYVRYKNHEHSSKMEKPLLYCSKRKREILQLSLSHEIFKNEEYQIGSNDIQRDCQKRSHTIHRTDARNASYSESVAEDIEASNDNAMIEQTLRFYTDSVWELIKARFILCSSYAYGYYLDKSIFAETSKDIESEGTANKDTKETFHSLSQNPLSLLASFKSSFELLQRELEEVTETLSEMVSRPLARKRTPRQVIIQTLHLCRKRRQEFLIASYRGCLPVETPLKPSDDEVLTSQEAQWNKFYHKHSNKYISRKPFTQIQAQQTSYSRATLPKGRYRLRSFPKSHTDDPWLVKENQTVDEKSSKSNIHNPKELGNTKINEIELENHILRRCRRQECTTEFLVENINKNEGNRTGNFSSCEANQFCSFKCLKSYEGNMAKAEDWNPEFKYSKRNELVETETSLAKRSVNMHSTSHHGASCHTIKENKSSKKESGGPDPDDDDDLFTEDTAYHANIGQYLYTLPRTSRSDDNLLLSDTANSITAPKPSIQDDAQVESPPSSNNLKLQGDITMNLDTKSISTDGLETKTVATDAVGSFLKTLAMQDDSHSTSFKEDSNIEETVTTTELNNHMDGSKKECSTCPNSFKNKKFSGNRKYGEKDDGKNRVETIFVKHVGSRKYLQKGHEKLITFKLLKRSRSTGEINQSSGKKAAQGAKASHHKKSNTVRNNKLLQGKTIRSKMINEARSPMKKMHIRKGHNEAANKNNEMPSEGIVIDAEFYNQMVENEFIKIKRIEKKSRPKFDRQTAFDLDSDSNEGTASRNTILDPSPTLKTPESQGLRSENDKFDGENGKKMEIESRANQSKEVIDGQHSQENAKSTTRRRHPGLTIKIQNSSFVDDTDELFTTLDKELTRSPTLNISGISISRSPGGPPLSASPLADPSFTSNRNRSASLVVPPPTPQTASITRHVGSNMKLATSCNTSPRSPGKKSQYFTYLPSPNTTSSATLHTPSSSPYKSTSLSQNLLFTFPDPPNSTSENNLLAAPNSKNVSPSTSSINKGSNSPSTGNHHLLSSVLHVQGRCLSSDDFHEALFLDKKSPNKTMSNKKKRRSKKRDSSSSHSGTAKISEQSPTLYTENKGMDNISATDQKENMKIV